MKKEELERIIAAMEIDIDSIEMQTLGAVIRAENLIYASPTIEYIYELLKKKTRVSKNWIYKTLSELEEEGYLVTDKIRRPHLYLTQNEKIEQALDKKRLKIIYALEKEIKSIEDKIELLETANLAEFYNLMANKEEGMLLARDPAIIEGAENVEMSTTRAIFASAKEGDIIRSLTPLRILDKGLVNSGKLELEMTRALERGAIVKSLMIPTTIDLKEINGASNFFHLKHKEMLRYTRNNRILVRIYPRPHQTYRFLALNDERIVMFMTNIASPEIALITTNRGIPRFIEDALRTWTRLWDQAIDANEQVIASLEQAI
ncbi:MAG: hypothetical protein ACTSYL_11490 [Candidatus Thorarchaeota archaeon]